MPKSMYKCLHEHFIAMSPLESYLILACTLKQLGLKLLTNPWDGLTKCNIEWFGAMLYNMIGFLCALQFWWLEEFCNIP
jgi:hypothetical protein